jgi:hypothetical protein
MCFDGGIDAHGHSDRLLRMNAFRQVYARNPDINVVSHWRGYRIDAHMGALS